VFPCVLLSHCFAAVAESSKVALLHTDQLSIASSLSSFLSKPSVNLSSYVDLREGLTELIGKPIILCSFTFIAKENRKSYLQLFVWGIASSREICRVGWCVSGWFSWLCARSPTASTFSAVHVVRGRPLPFARSMDPVVCNRFWKSSTPCLLSRRAHCTGVETRFYLLHILFSIPPKGVVWVFGIVKLVLRKTS